MKRIFTNHVLGGMFLAAALMLSGAAFAQGQSWADVVSQAMAGQKGLTMDMVHSYAEREKQFVGFSPWMDAHFTEIDVNADGMITMDEMHVWMKKNNMSDDQLTKAWYEQGR